ncbi:MAG: tetratricopeptide repeat protein [Bdellovibrionota bacterium]
MNINAEFVERYQLELARDPKSRVFAPLAEAYRKMGLVEEAKRICMRGTQFHPDFAGGHVAFAKVLIDAKDFAQALPHLEKAARLSPDNILAHSLMGETLLELRRPKDALKAFKMVLFLNPADAKAQTAVQKWEFLTADEYDEQMFDTMKPELVEILEETTSTGIGRGTDSRIELAQRHARALERAISLADAFTIRNDLEAALKVVDDAIRLLGSHAELEKRAALLARRLQILSEPEDVPEESVLYDMAEHTGLLAFGSGPAAGELPAEIEMPDDSLELELGSDPRKDEKRAKLESLLRRISERRS